MSTTRKTMDQIKFEAEMHSLLNNAIKANAEAHKLTAEQAKLNAERRKLERDAWWHPVTVAGGLMAAGAALAAVLTRLP
jgi:hypothetical protein